MLYEPDRPGSDFGALETEYTPLPEVRPPPGGRRGSGQGGGDVPSLRCVAPAEGELAGRSRGRRRPRMARFRSRAMAALLLQPLTVAAAPGPITSADAEAWLRWLLPLPKQVKPGLVGRTARRSHRVQAPARRRSRSRLLRCASCSGRWARCSSRSASHWPTRRNSRGVPTRRSGYRLRPDGDDALDATAATPQGLWNAAQTPAATARRRPGAATGSACRWRRCSTGPICRIAGCGAVPPCGISKRWRPGR